LHTATRQPSASLFLVISLGVLGACSDSVDRAAKKRIFSPEDPPQVVASAAEKLPAEDVGDDARVTRRILGMGAAEATERLGPHRFIANITFEWNTKDRPELKLVENRTLVAGPGGVSGDFHAKVENSRDQGLEVLRVHGKVYAKNRYGRFRERLRDRGMAEREREEIYRVLRDADALFQGRMKLQAQGTATYLGRTAWKYGLALADKPPKLPEETNLPAIAFPKNVDQGTQRRLAFFEKREPKSLQGEVLVDAQTSVVLKATIHGRIQAPATKTEPGAELKLAMDTGLSDLGVDPKLKPPENALPDADKPQGIAEVLARFGISAAKPDAGTTSDDRPDED
jgi:hypothetical protein